MLLKIPKLRNLYEYHRRWDRMAKHVPEGLELRDHSQIVEHKESFGNCGQDDDRRRICGGPIHGKPGVYVPDAERAAAGVLGHRILFSAMAGLLLLRYHTGSTVPSPGSP